MEDYFTGWLLMVGEYFPGMAIPPTIPADDPDQVADTIPANDVPDTTDQVANTVPASTTNTPAPTTDQVATFQVDRNRLAGCFKSEFTRPIKGSGYCAFDAFYNELTRRANDKQSPYTTTDWGRVGYQVKQSRHVVPGKLKPFRKWFELLGVLTPGEPSPGTYKDKTENTDFSAWL